MGSLIFRFQFLKSYRSLKCLLLFVTLLLRLCKFICIQDNFPVGHSYNFLCKQLLLFQSLFIFKFKAVSLLFAALLGLPPAPYMGFAAMPGDEYILNFLFTNRLRFQPTNNAEQ